MILRKMKKILLLILLLPACLLAQNPKWFKKARKIQLTVMAYDAEGDIRQGQGYFINEQGDAVMEYDVLKGAVRAVAIDADGKEHHVTHILGASSLYNVAKVQTDCQKVKAIPLAMQTAQKQETVYVMPVCSKDNKVPCYVGLVADIQEFGEGHYPYYTLQNSIDERFSGCPAFNENGELIGHIQLPASGKDQPAYILGARFHESFRITALDLNNSDLKAIGITKALPEDEAQATSYLLLYNRQDKEAYRKVIDLYLQKFPAQSTGYVQLAEEQAAAEEYKAAEATYAKGLEMCPQQADELHHAFAKALYQRCVKQDSIAPGWTMERALQEAETAFNVKPLPLYTSLQGMCLYALQRYGDAYGKFMEVTASNLRSPEYFHYAIQCKTMMRAGEEEILALQDSCVACFTKPYPTEAVNYLYPRAKTLASLKRYREAVADMNECEHLLAGNVNANFYYEREQMEIQCRMYPAALTDIERAVKLAPQDPSMRAEEAALNYRVGQLDQAVSAAREAIKIDSEYPDAYRILGLALRDKGMKKEAREALQKAIELGDTLSQGILDKME